MIPPTLKDAYYHGYQEGLRDSQAEVDRLRAALRFLVQNDAGCHRELLNLPVKCHGSDLCNWCFAKATLEERHYD